MATLLSIPRHLYDRMIAHCREEWPREACGIMTGKNGVVRRIWALRNAHPQPHSRYQIDPVDQQTAMRDVLAGKEELVAIYHSHPTTVAYPSQTDIAMAHYPEAFYVILSLAQDPPDVQAYRIVGGQVTRVPHRKIDDPTAEWIDLR